jgi:hypothetical protein
VLATGFLSAEANMMDRILSGGIVALLLGLAPAALRAQTTVEGGVVVQSGPVTAHVGVNEPPPPPPVVVYHEPVREVVVVERIHEPEGNAYGWWKKHGYREVVVYYDGDNYYDHWFERRGGLRRLVVYERGGRYYRPVDRDHWRLLFPKP